MEFLVTPRTVVFDFLYGSYRISIADYMGPAPAEDYVKLGQTSKPEGKITVMVMQGEESISSMSIEKLALYIRKRVAGQVDVYNTVMELRLEPSDQFMSALLDAIRIVLPRA